MVERGHIQREQVYLRRSLLGRLRHLGGGRGERKSVHPKTFGVVVTLGGPYPDSTGGGKERREETLGFELVLGSTQNRSTLC